MVHLLHLRPSCHLGLEQESVLFVRLEDRGGDLPSQTHRYLLRVFVELIWGFLPQLF